MTRRYENLCFLCPRLEKRVMNKQSKLFLIDKKIRKLMSCFLSRYVSPFFVHLI